jgi:hypothetical protein
VLTYLLLICLDKILHGDVAQYRLLYSACGKAQRGFYNVLAYCETEVHVPYLEICIRSEVVLPVRKHAVRLTVSSFLHAIKVSEIRETEEHEYLPTSDAPMPIENQPCLRVDVFFVTSEHEA